MTPSADTLQRHAQALAAAFGARLIESAQLLPEEAFAVQGLRCAFVHSIIDETTYAVALHELGHLAAPLGFVSKHHALDANKANLRLDAEDAAWQWARHYALLWTPAMEAVATWAEGTYAAAPAATPQPPVAAPQAPVAPVQQINWNDWK